MTTFNAISSCPYTDPDPVICDEEPDTTFKQKLVQGYEFTYSERQGRTVTEDLGLTTFMF